MRIRFRHSVFDPLIRSGIQPEESGPVQFSLQEEVYRDHLLLSPFKPGETVFKGNFPKRNRVMALLSDATVIVEASDTSGSLHQAAKCQRLGRWLFIMRAVADDPSLTGAARFIGQPGVGILKSSRRRSMIVYFMCT